MFCRRCGAQLNEGDRFCKSCGARVEEEKREGDVPPIDPSLYGGASRGYQSPYDTYAPVGGQPLPMKWFQFLIYFSLFAGAVLNAIEAIRIFTGTYYVDVELGNYTMMQYTQYSGLRAMDMVYAALLLLYSGFMIYTRFALAGFRRHAPMCLTIMYVVQFVISAGYSILFVALFESGENLLVMATIFAVLVELAVCAAMILINRIYFNNRKHLFTK